MNGFRSFLHGWKGNFKENRWQDCWRGWMTWVKWMTRVNDAGETIFKMPRVIKKDVYIRKIDTKYGIKNLIFGISVRFFTDILILYTPSHITINIYEVVWNIFTGSILIKSFTRVILKKICIYEFIIKYH